MDEQKLWELFFATGRPEVYLSSRRQRNREDWDELPARQAFQSKQPPLGRI